MLLTSASFFQKLIGWITCIFGAANLARRYYLLLTCLTLFVYRYASGYFFDERVNLRLRICQLLGERENENSSRFRCVRADGDGAAPGDCRAHQAGPVHEQDGPGTTHPPTGAGGPLPDVPSDRRECQRHHQHIRG